MSNNYTDNEKGQAIVVLVLVIIGLLGALALAVDGGMILYDRRSAQNASDAAALAGAFELANDPWNTVTLSNRIQSAALERARNNGYSVDTGKTVAVDFPPAEGTFHYVSNDTNINHYIRVRITSPVNTSFMHFVYLGPVQNQVETVVHVIPPVKGNIYPGSGLVSLAPHSCDKLYAGGNVNANLIGGGIFVNSDDPNCALNVQGASNQIYSPEVTVVGGLSNAGGLIVEPGPPNSPSPASSVPYPPIDAPAKPTCSSPVTSALLNPPVDKRGNGVTYNMEIGPGYLNNTLPNKDIWFKPGIYCFHRGFDINNNQHIGGDGVLFFITYNPAAYPCSNSWNGGATIQLTYYQEDPYKGLLIYVDPGDYGNHPNKPLTFNGNQDSYIKGTVYAPSCTVKMNGTGGNFYRGQMIGYDITLLGGAAINLQYVSGDNWQPLKPSKVDLTQ
jgi:Flp pilus assembly protein TadG